MAEITARNYRSPLTEGAQQIAGGAATATLEQLLKGKSAADQAKLQALLKGQGTEEDIKRAKEALSSGELPEGASIKVGDVSVGQDPASKMLGMQMQGESKAANAAQAVYMKGLPGLQKVAGPAQEMLDLINDPKQPGAAGLAKTLAIRLQGMNRYNQAEGGGIVPTQLMNVLGNAVNALTGQGDNPLTPSQKQALNTQAMQALQSVNDQHEILKKNALQQYGSSNFANTAHAQILQQSLGSPFTQSIQDKLKKYAPEPQNPQVAPGQAPPQQGLASRLGMGLAGVKPLPQQQVPQTPPGAMDIDSFLKSQRQ